MSTRFRIAFSFAGEKRDFVDGVAEILAARFGKHRILYDKYYQGEFARDKLSVYLPNLYVTAADLVVVVICKEYNEKLWTGLEWKAVLELLKGPNGKKVMFCRFNYTEAEGLEGVTGYIDLDNMQPEDAVALVLERLASNEGRDHDDHYTKPVAEWPAVVPELNWPVADHVTAREAFGALITCNAKYRYLPIAGEHDTGKTYLATQFIINARQKIPGVRRGVYKFQGGTEMGEELRKFALDLKVPKLEKVGQDVVAPLDKIFDALKDVPWPTLLIFDGFDPDGPGSQWVVDKVLRKMEDYRWLRVVILGENVPGAEDGEWGALSAEKIVLERPTAEDWLPLCMLRNPAVDLTFARNVHIMFNGSPSLIAGICGPKK